jgi:membrane-associated phospholipid phosphatase
VDDFFASDHFAPLMQRLPDDLIASRAMDYLLSVRGSQTVGGGISAMPSLHVAIVVLIGLCFRFRLPRWQWGAWTYAGVIFVGSIHLGWHYASDGLVGALGAWAIWRGTGFIFPAEPAADVP